MKVLTSVLYHPYCLIIRKPNGLIRVTLLLKEHICDPSHQKGQDMLPANTVLRYRPVKFVKYKENNRNKYAS